MIELGKFSTHFQKKSSIAQRSSEFDFNNKVNAHSKKVISFAIVFQQVPENFQKKFFLSIICIEIIVIYYEWKYYSFNRQTSLMIIHFFIRFHPFQLYYLHFHFKVLKGALSSW